MSGKSCKIRINRAGTNHPLGPDLKNFSLHLSRICDNIMIVICGTLAQLEEQLTLNQRVVGSSPSCPITKQYDAQLCHYIAFLFL